MLSRATTINIKPAAAIILRTVQPIITRPIVRFATQPQSQQQPLARSLHTTTPLERHHERHEHPFSYSRGGDWTNWKWNRCGSYFHPRGPHHGHGGSSTTPPTPPHGPHGSQSRYYGGYGRGYGHSGDDFVRYHLYRSIRRRRFWRFVLIALFGYGAYRYFSRTPEERRAHKEARAAMWRGYEANANRMMLLEADERRSESNESNGIDANEGGGLMNVNDSFGERTWCKLNDAHRRWHEKRNSLAASEVVDTATELQLARRDLARTSREYQLAAKRMEQLTQKIAKEATIAVPSSTLTSLAVVEPTIATAKSEPIESVSHDATPAAPTTNSS